MISILKLIITVLFILLSLISGFFLFDDVSVHSYLFYFLMDVNRGAFTTAIVYLTLFETKYYRGYYFILLIVAYWLSAVFGAYLFFGSEEFLNAIIDICVGNLSVLYGFVTGVAIVFFISKALRLLFKVRKNTYLALMLLVVFVLIFLIFTSLINYVMSWWRLGYLQRFLFFITISFFLNLWLRSSSTNEKN